MPYENYINLQESGLDKPIYRIMPVHRLLQTLEQESLTLVPPKKWDDPFENLLLSSYIKYASTGESGDMGPMRDKIYGQCWTLHRETDAMWRIYSPDSNAAKVKTTPRKLLEALRLSTDCFGDVKCFIGKVEYQTQDDLVYTLKRLNLFNTNGSGVAESLLYKRREFSHEREVRLIFTDGSGPIYRFPVAPNRLFEEVVFDPRMDKNLYEAFAAAVKAKGYANRVDQSVLYRPPKKLLLEL